MAEVIKSASIYLGEDLGTIVVKKAEDLGINRSEFLRYCVTYALCPEPFGGKPMDDDVVKRLKSIISNGFDQEYIDFLISKQQKHDMKHNINDNSNIVDNANLYKINTVSNTTDNKKDVENTPEDIQDGNTKDNIEDTTKDTTKKRKSKIPPAKDIQFEGSMI